MRKFTTILLTMLFMACAAGVSVFAAGQQAEGGAEGGVTVSPAGVFPIVDEKITLSVFMAQDPMVVDYEDNYLTKLFEEKSNIHIDFQLVPSQQAADKMNLVLASGADLPDIFMRGSSNSLAMKYGQEGIFIPLNDMIEKYGVQMKRVMQDMNERGVDFLKVYQAPDGNIYGMPWINECPQCETIWRCWVDMRWLEKLGAEKPATLDEFYDLMVTFRDTDMNENGKQDEIPLMTASTGWGCGAEGFLMMPFLIYDPATRVILDEDSGEVTMAYLEDEWFEGVRYVKKLIDDGILDPVSLTQTNQEMKVIGESEPTITGAFMASNFQWLTLKDEKFMNFEVIPPLKGVYTGERQTFSNKYQPLAGMKLFITDACEYPEAAFRWGDMQYTKENTRIMRYGKEEEDWVLAEPNEKNPFGDPAVFKEISQWGSPTNNSWRQGGLGYMDAGLALYDRFFPERNQATQFVANTVPYWDAAVTNSMPPLFMLPEEVDEFAELETALDTYVDESFARFVTGDLPLSAYDDFIAEVKKIGVDRFIEMNEMAYKRQYLQ
jgi:putative aldouronate transport system substrate-binding protein